MPVHPLGKVSPFHPFAQSPCFNILTFCSVSSCRPLSNKIGFTRFGASTQKLFSFRVCCFHCWPAVPVPGTVLPLGNSGAQFRSHGRLFFPGTGTVSSPEIWTGSRTGSTGPPEVPVTVAVLPLATSGGNFQRYFCLFSQVLDVLESPGF